MGKIFDIKITDFSGGLSEDKRSQNASKFSITKHFDVFTYPHKIVPRNKTQALTGADKTLKIFRTLYAPLAALTTYVMWGLGQTTPSGFGQPYTYNVNTLVWDMWSGITGAVIDTRVFFYYKSFIYMFCGGSRLERLDVTASGPTLYQSVSYTDLAKPILHPSDDCAYFFVDNKIYRINGTNWDGLVLTLPSDVKITCATPHGNYLAIGTTTLGSLANKSVVYVWDRDSSLSTVSERIDFGSGVLRHLASLDGKLIGVVTDLGYNIGNVFIKQVSGSSAVIINRLIVESPLTTDFPDTRVIKDNKLYVPMKAQYNGDTRFGIWSIDGNGRTTIDTIIDGATSYQDINLLEDQWWICHSGDYSVDASVTNKTFSTTLSSVYESLIFNGGDSGRNKKLIGITVFTEPLPAAGQIVLKYRRNEETAWTTIFTNTTDNSISHSAINIEGSDPEVKFNEFKEIQFQINSTGGAIVTGYKLRYEELDNDLY